MRGIGLGVPKLVAEHGAKSEKRADGRRGGGKGQGRADAEEGWRSWGNVGGESRGANDLAAAAAAAWLFAPTIWCYCLLSSYLIELEKNIQISLRAY